jgi:multiple sugar transport system ATP-binding protein
MTRITFENVSKKYGKLHVLKEFNLSINDKELFVLLGAGGAGKSTILKLIAGIEEPTSGKIFFDDTVVNHLTPRQRDVALMFQSYALYPNKTVYENLAFPLRVRKRPKDEIEKSVTEVSKSLGISHLLQKYPGLLSGGERQRVAVGRAMIRKPKVYLFDEPLTNLDAKLRVVTRTEIKRLQRELEATTVYATPDSLEASTIADRIAVLNLGKMEQLGTPSELYMRPINTYVAKYTGTSGMNFIPCSASADGNSVKVSAEGFELKGTRPSETTKIPKDVILGVRPEDVKLSTGGDGINARVTVVEQTRPEMVVYLTLGSSSIVALTSATDEMKGGSDTRITFNRGRLHLFSKETEEEIPVDWNGQSKNREPR